MLDDLGLLPALIWHSTAIRSKPASGCNSRPATWKGRRFPAELETAAYRIVQEALTNVARHAGVKQAAVSIWVEGRRYT